MIIIIIIDEIKYSNREYFKQIIYMFIFENDVKVTFATTRKNC